MLGSSGHQHVHKVLYFLLINLQSDNSLLFRVSGECVVL